MFRSVFDQKHPDLAYTARESTGDLIHSFFDSYRVILEAVAHSRFVMKH